MTKHVVSAIIYDKKGRVLAVGNNNYLKTHPIQAKFAAQVGQDYKVFLHAEVHAITKCRDISLAHKIRVFRYNANGEPVNAAPCAICRSAIASTAIKIVEHT